MTTTITSSKFPRILAISALAALASGTAVCRAADGVALQTTVKYGDLNVSSSQGAGALYNRIRFAAENVCRPLKGDSLTSKQLFHDCMDHAIADAVNKVNEPALSSVYDAKTGTSKRIVLASSQTR